MLKVGFMLKALFGLDYLGHEGVACSIQSLHHV